MKMSFAVSLILTLTLLLPGCAAPTPTPIPTNTPAPTATAVLRTETPAPLPSQTATAKPEIKVTRHCLPVTNDISQLSGKDYGTIIFARDDSSTALLNKLDKPYLYEPGINKKKSIDGINFAVSLDRTMLVYELPDQDEIFVSDKTGMILATSDSKYDWITRWVQNGLLLRTYAEDASKITHLNPFTGDRITLHEDFPNRHIIDYAMWGIGINVYYSPKLDKVLYLAKDDTGKYISLWDTVTNKEVVRISDFLDGYYSPEAEWSIDGEQVIIRLWTVNQDNLFSIHQNGQIETLFSSGQLSDKDAIQYALAPDSKKLALWLFNNSSQKWELAVLDIPAKKAVNYCIESKYFPSGLPIWSPDSYNLLFQIHEDTDNTSTVMIDLEKNIAVQIAENAKAAGWLK